MADVRESTQGQKSETQQQQGEQTNVPVENASGERAPNVQIPNRMLTPFEEMERIMDRIFEGIVPRGMFRTLGFDRPYFSGLSRSIPMEMLRAPNVDVVNRDEDILVRAEVPGVDKDQLQVSVTDNMLTIRGETRHEERTGEGDYFRQEISRGSFSRTVPLPSEVDGSKAKAVFKNGILELTLPKIEKSRRHTIAVE